MSEMFRPRKSYEIRVNLDAKCSICGKSGVVEKSGICMACITKKIQRGELDHIINKYKPSIRTK